MNNTNKKVCVIGLGYIGLPTAALLASENFEVSGVDINKNAVDTINKGEIHIVEPDLDAYVRSAVSAGRLKAYLEPVESDVYIICVPTPFSVENDMPAPDISCVLSAANSIAPLVKPGDIVILESTSPVGTTDRIKQVFLDHSVDCDKLHIAYCPERVLPGKVMLELVENDRVVGGINQKDTGVVAEFYKNFVRGEILETDAKTAEMCKLTENSFRDVNIAFANELSMICDKLSINVWELISLANRHPRVNILKPGPGVGGHCIAVDPWFIVSSAPEESVLIKTARLTNEKKPRWVINKIKTEIQKHEKDSVKIACFGLAFKADIDDLRESPAVEIVRELVQENVNQVMVVEPNVDELPKQLAGKVELASLESAIEFADILVLLVDHKEFKNIDKTLISEKVVIDTRGDWDFSN